MAKRPSVGGFHVKIYTSGFSELKVFGPEENPHPKP